jgi:hypothetical protein
VFPGNLPDEAMALGVARCEHPHGDDKKEALSRYYLFSSNQRLDVVAVSLKLFIKSMIYANGHGLVSGVYMRLNPNFG